MLSFNAFREYYNKFLSIIYEFSSILSPGEERLDKNFSSNYLIFFLLFTINTTNTIIIIKNKQEQEITIIKILI
jgi:hypothetical protein